VARSILFSSLHDAQLCNAIIPIASQRLPCCRSFLSNWLRETREPGVAGGDRWHEPTLGGGFANAVKAAHQSKDHIVAEVQQTPASRAKSKPTAGSPFEFPKFPMGKFEFPAQFQEFAEKSTLQAQENYDKLRNATEEVTGAFKGAYEAAAKGTRDYGVRLIEAGRTNLNATFDYAIELLAAKSPSEVAELSTAHLGRQFDALTEQSKELTTLAQKIAMETAEPLNEGVNKAFRPVV
jgi:phasin